MKRIKKFGVIQTAKVAALIYFFISLVFIVPLFLFSSAFSMNSGANDPFGLFGGFFILLLPFLYAAFAFVFAAIGCLVYNMISNWVGGIEVELESVEPEENLDQFGKPENTY